MVLVSMGRPWQRIVPLSIVLVWMVLAVVAVGTGSAFGAASGSVSGSVSGPVFGASEGDIGAGTVSGVSSSGSEPGSPSIRLVHSDMFPAEHPLGRLTLEWAREVAARTDGRVEIVVHSGGTLTSPQECFDGVLDGRSDMCHTALAYTPHRFPVMEAADFPGYPADGGTARLTTRVAHEIFSKYGRSEFAGMHVLYIHAHPPGVFMSNDEYVARVDDLRGLIVRSTGLSAAITTILGGTPVEWPATQTYELLKQDVVDATMAPLESLKYNGFADVTRYSAIAPELGYVTTFAVVMRDDVWASLPPDVQSVIDDLSVEYQAKAAATWDEAGREGFEYALSRGHRFTTLAENEVARWSRRVFEELAGDYVRRLAALDVDGRQVLNHRAVVIDAYVRDLPMSDSQGIEKESENVPELSGLVFEFDEQTVEVPFARLRAELPTVVTAVENPFFEESRRTYEGFWLEDLLRYMPLAQRDKLVFHTKDLYEADIAVSELTDAPLRGLLAFREIGADGRWTPVVNDDEVVDPSPYWLVWSPVEPALDGPPSSVSIETVLNLPWPWQTVGIRLVESCGEGDAAVHADEDARCTP